MPRRSTAATWVRLVLGGAAAAAALWVACPRRSGGLAASPAAAPPEASRTTATKSSPELIEATGKASRDMLAKLGGGFASVVQPPFVVLGNMPEAALKRMTQSCVLDPAKAMWASYFAKRPNQVITALLFADEKSYREGAKKLFGDTDVAHFGYYRPSDRTLVMNISTGGGTLIHELTHALIVYDFPDVPAWFNEGLGSLHEQCYVQADRVVGRPNWRLPELQKAIRSKTLRSLRDLLTSDQFYGAGGGMNYAQARYFVMYMQEKALLAKFYAAYRDGHEGKDAAVKLVEKLFGQELEKVEADCLKWVLTLRFPEE